ncbi:hypothetical protein BGZ82_003720, partial [Podila clonocystis]
PSTVQKHSVLVLGKSQAGKSALVQHIMSYAAQDYSIDQSLLGDGTFAKTESTRSIPVKSSLPSYEVFSRHTNCTIHLKDLDTDYKDDEDYHDLLFSREAAVGLRLSPEDPDKPSPETMEFVFLDTPGLCNHEDKDCAYAIDTITNIVAAQSVSLILVIINHLDPLTAELLLALQYYSDVLLGLNCLHSNIAFVFTHVDYAHSRLSKKSLNLALEEKTFSMSRILRGSMSENFEPYPKFTIDFAQNPRPVVQYMIRNTIRDILQLAVTKSPLFVDATIANVEQVKTIIHPSNFSDNLREEVLGLIYRKLENQPKVDLNQEGMASMTAAEADQKKIVGDVHSGKSSQDNINKESQPQPKVDVKQEDPTSNTTLEEVNILVIGDVQSGRTSLIEAMKQYSNSGLFINEEHVVCRVNDNADEIINAAVFHTSLYKFEIRTLLNGRHRLVDIEEDARSLNQGSFDEVLNLEQERVDARRIPSSTRVHQFKLFEAPGFHDTENLQQKINAIHRSFVESQTDVHHVIVTLAPDSLTSATRTVISTFSNIFPEICQHMSFVHTKINYHNLHVSNELFHDSIKDKKEQLEHLTGKIPSIFLIDSCQHTERPIQRAIAQNEVHSILQAVVKDKPERSVLTLGKPRYSMLILGQTQSGKSTLLENIKKYADPAYEINQSFLGNGNVSKTLSTIQFTIDSNLPLYEVLGTTGVALDLQNLEEGCNNEDDFIDLLQSRERDYTLRPVPQDPPSPSPQLVEVKFLDTPGLNDTNHQDAVFAKNIIQEITAAQSFNLILFTVSTKVSLSMEYGFALEYYAKVLEGLHSRIVFLYTHVDFRLCSSFNQTHQDALATRHRACSSIFRDRKYEPAKQTDAGNNLAVEGAMEYRRFTIDMPQVKRPVIQCLIRNRIRDILQLTVTSSPVVLDSSKRNTNRIRNIIHPDKGNRAYRDNFGIQLGKNASKWQAQDDNSAGISQSRAQVGTVTPVANMLRPPQESASEEQSLVLETSNEVISFDEMVARMRACS